MDDVPTLTEAELRGTMELCRREMLDGRRYSAAPHAGIDWPSSLSAVCRQALAQTAELEALRGILDAPREALFDGREPSRNEVHLLNLLSWRQQEAGDAKAERDKLQAFKDWCHTYLDAHGVPHHPPGSHGAEGCRIGDRMDWLTARLRAAESDRDRLRCLCQQLETARDERDAYRRDLEEIGRIIGCGHVEDGLARCVRDALEKAKE